jgi:hypothetical protein
LPVPAKKMHHKRESVFRTCSVEAATPCRKSRI